MDINAAADKDAVAKSSGEKDQDSNTVGDRQSKRGKTLNSKMEEYVGLEKNALGILFSWTGRCPTNQAFCRAYGFHFQSATAGIVAKLMTLITRVARYCHSKCRRQPQQPCRARGSSSNLEGLGGSLSSYARPGGSSSSHVGP